jgi:tetratricopeptide (TPR) repeat protein
MRRLMISFAVYLGLAMAAQAQIGKSVTVTAGTPEDAALSKIYEAPDGPDKIQLLDEFVKDFGSNGDLTLLADQLYVQTYLAQKNYAKVNEFGEKALALDPDDFSTAVNIFRAAVEQQSDTPKLFALGEKVAAIVARYKVAPKPERLTPESWAALRENNLTKAEEGLGYVQYTLLSAAYKAASPAARATLFERYVAIFPDSPYTPTAREQTAVAYQQAQNTPKMLEAAQNILAADPNDISMLLLLADFWSDGGQQLEKAAANAQKALDLLKQAKKPDNLTDEQWQQQVSLQKGLAYTSLGEVDVVKGRNAEAVDAFKQASPLLKSNTITYARNLYRWGFTLAKMQRIPEARTVLSEAVSINSPYKSRAQETLDKIGGAVPRSSTHKSS